MCKAKLLLIMNNFFSILCGMEIQDEQGYKPLKLPLPEVVISKLINKTNRNLHLLIDGKPVAKILAGQVVKKNITIPIKAVNKKHFKKYFKDMPNLDLMADRLVNNVINAVNISIIDKDNKKILIRSIFYRHIYIIPQNNIYHYVIGFSLNSLRVGERTGIDIPNPKKIKQETYGISILFDGDNLENAQVDIAGSFR